jgi:hypothetical protein
MRKSFKNKVKELGVSGNFDIPISKDPPKPGSLFSMMEAPQEEWDGAHTRGKEIAKGFDSVLPNLGKALMMAKGVIPKSKWDSSVLGEVAAPAAAKAVPVQNGARTPVPNPGVARAKSELPRPKRNVKKRTYQDSSYEGYGEGYVDDESHETGYSTNDGDDRGAAKKRPKKVCKLLCRQYSVANRNQRIPKVTSQVPLLGRTAMALVWLELDRRNKEV